MLKYSHNIDSRYPAKSFVLLSEDDRVLQPLSPAITHGNILFNDCKSEEFATRIMDFNLKAEGLAKERDFYNKKLRDIETLLGVMEDGINDPTVKRIIAIIYESQEIRKVKKKRGRNKKRGKKGGNEELEDYPLITTPHLLDR